MISPYSSHLLRDEFCRTTAAEQRSLFFDKSPMAGRRALGHGPNSARCEFVEDGFGAVIHELGHAFGLSHDLRNEKQDVMGNGFRELRTNLLPNVPPARRVGFSRENAMLLMSSRYIASDLTTDDDEPPKVEISLVAQREGAVVKVNASDNTGLRTLVIVDSIAGSVVGGRLLKGTKQELQISVPARSKGNEVQLLVIVTDVGGHQTRIEKTFSISK